MAIHIADREVSELMTEYSRQTGMTKTEALRRLLRAALAQEVNASKKQNLRAVARQIWKKNKGLNLPAVTKEEADAIFE